MYKLDKQYGTCSNTGSHDRDHVVEVRFEERRSRTVSTEYLKYTGLSMAPVQKTAASLKLVQTPTALEPSVVESRRFMKAQLVLQHCMDLLYGS